MLTEFLYLCSECKKEYSADSVRYLCPSCSTHNQHVVPLRGVLEVRFDYDAISRKIGSAELDFELFCPVEKKYHPPLPVGNTPLIRAFRLENTLGLANIYIKNDGQNPSGSLKDRASFLVVAEAIRLGEEQVVTASTGNAASALAAVSASAGKRAIIYVPKSTPRGKLVQSLMYGADVRIVDGTYDDAFLLSLEHTNTSPGLNRNTAYHPFTIEGKKTVAFEIFRDLGRVPDFVFVPMGDGVIIAAVYKGFYDLFMANVTHAIPRLVGVQGTASDAIYHFWKTGTYRPASNPDTIADSISVSAPSNAFMAKYAIEKTNGFAVLVTDEEILRSQKILAKFTGIFSEPAAAASIAGIYKCIDEIDKDATCVAVVTGNGLKDIDSAMGDLSFPKSTWSPI